MQWRRGKENEEESQKNGKGKIGKKGRITLGVGK